MNTASGIIRALNSGVKHLAIKRFTLRYPEQKLKFVGDGYQYDPVSGVGIAGYKGRHLLFHDKCTGCQLCAIACEGVAEAIGMVKVDEKWKHNKKAIMPQIDYGKCVFCGLCVDACPFYALYMSNDYELSSYSKEALIYTPAQLQVKAQISQDVQIAIDDRGATHSSELPPPTKKKALPYTQPQLEAKSKANQDDEKKKDDRGATHG
ncbi:MAG: 4Fe-4S binding protein [Nitrosopumilaceae archaeon]